VDDASCTNASTPICKATPPPSVCVECVTNAHCASATRPACDTTTNFCGCEDDDDCAATMGNTDFCDSEANNSRGECKVCLTDNSCKQADPNKPFCENQTACIQCRTTADCAITHTCNTNTKVCEQVPGADPTTTNQKIVEFNGLATGTFTSPFVIENAFVTYIKPAIGDPAAGDTAGFFLQALHNGPAMFVSAAPGTLQVGDRISLSIGAKVQFSGGVRAASNVSGITVVSSGHPVQNLHTATPAGLAVDVSGASDLVTNVEAYFGKIIRMTGTLNTPITGAGSAHSAADVKTAGMTTGTLPRLRLLTTFANQYELVSTCTFTLDVGVMWKFTTSGTTPTTTPQPSAYSLADFSALGCPAPRVLKARAPTPTQVVLTFDRTLDITTVQPEDFTIATLSVTSVTVNGKEVTLTTTTQTAGQQYTVSVDGEVKDVAGKGVDPNAKSTTFVGFSPPPSGPSLVINEVDADNSGTDLTEFIEIHNRGGQAADLSKVILLLVNGDETVTPRKEYLRFPLTGVRDANGAPATSLPAGGYIVAGSSTYLRNTTLPAGTFQLTIAASSNTPGSNIIQNGDDGIGLLDDTTGTLIDSVFYLGIGAVSGPNASIYEIATGAGTKQLNFLEGNVATARDPAVGVESIGRSPNGIDANNNDADFLVLPSASPGAANQ
jgi:hypothetical protein